MRISVNNILELQQEGQLKKLATFIYMKSLYKNSCVFDYSIKSFAKKSKLSRHHVRKNVEFFLASGWCRMHHNNLVFCKYDRRPTEAKEWIIRKRDVFTGKSIKEITVLLLSIVLKQKQDQFNYIQKIKSDLEKSKTSEFISLRDYKRAIKAQKKYNIIAGADSNFKMSVKTIGDLFNISKSSVCSLLKKMQEMSLVRIRGFYPEYIGHCTRSMWKSVEGLAGLIWLSHKNMVFIKKCNEYYFF